MLFVCLIIVRIPITQGKSPEDFFSGYGEKCKIRKIDSYEGDLQLEDIVANNVGKNELNLKMKYIMVRLDNLYRTLV